MNASLVGWFDNNVQLSLHKASNCTLVSGSLLAAAFSTLVKINSLISTSGLLARHLVNLPSDSPGLMAKKESTKFCKAGFPKLIRSGCVTA